MDRPIADDQLTAYKDRLEDAGMWEPLSPDQPEVAIPSVLTLTLEQEKRLVEHCLKRVDEIEKDTGRKLVLENSGSEPGADMDFARSMQQQDSSNRSFFVSRRLYELLYNLKVEWRQWAYGGIFTETNYPVPMSRRLVQQQISRAKNYFFGTDPWMAITPEGNDDEILAREIDRWAKYKVRKTRLRFTLDKAIDQAFIRGEGILKTAYVNQDDLYETEAEVGVTSTGELILAEDGDYIYRDDIWVTTDIPIEGAEMDPTTGEIPMESVEVLQRDMVTPRPPDVHWELRKITRTIPVKHGADVSIVHYLDFLCPRNAPTVDEADICAHLYEIPTIHLAQQIMSAENTRSRKEILAILQGLQNPATAETPETGKGTYRPELGESYSSDMGGGLDYDRQEPRSQIAECWVRFDVNQDGREENLFVLIDRQNQKPIHYNYTANVTPSGKRPFHVVRVNPVDNRWHGISQMELFEDQQKLVDLFVNRIVKATSQVSMVKFWDPSLTYEGEADPTLSVNGGETYTPKRGVKIEDILRTVPIYEPEIDYLYKMVEFVQQVTLNMSGVASTNDANMAGMDQTKLATGIRNIERTGQELFAPFLYSLEEGLVSVVQSWLDLEMYYLQEPEVYEYFEGDTRMLDELTPERVRDLSVDVRLELTRYRNEQQDVQLTQSIELVGQFYTQPFMIQQVLAPMYRQLLKLRDVQHADEIIVPIDPIVSGLMAPPVTPATGATNQPPSPAKPVTPVGPEKPAQSQPNL